MANPVSFGNVVTPVFLSQWAIAAQAASAVAAISSAGGDRITPGSSLSGLYNDALIHEIAADQALISTLSGIAANAPGMSAWVEPTSNSLVGQISSQTSSLNQNGGTITGGAGSSNTGAPGVSGIATLGATGSGGRTISGGVGNKGGGGGSVAGEIVTDSVGLSSADAAALATLSSNPWGATTSATDMATLSGLLQRDGPNTVLGADAVGAFQLISAGLDPSAAIEPLMTDAGMSGFTSTQSTVGSGSSVSAQDNMNFAVAGEEYNAGNWSAFVATLSNIATSSDPGLASIGSAELLIYAKEGPSAASLSAFLNCIGVPLTSATVSTITTDLSSATGSPMAWTGSSFVVPAAPLNTVNGAAWSSTVSSAVNSAILSIHIRGRGSTGDGVLNTDADNFTKAVSSFQANPNQQNSSLMASAEATFISRLKYDHASSAAIASVENSVGSSFINQAVDTSSNGTIGSQVNQASGSLGDCGTLASLHAMSTTSQGKQILEKSVRANPDGSYDVQFAGDPSQKVFHVTQAEMNDPKYGTADDPETIALLIGVEQYYSQNGGAGFEGQSPDGILPLLSGSSANALPTGSQSPSDIEAFLAQLAPQIGSSVSVDLVGNSPQSRNPDGSPDSNFGKWQPGNEHIFTLTGINEQSGTITYTNPWDSTISRTMSISQFASQAAGTDSEITATQT